MIVGSFNNYIILYSITLYGASTGPWKLDIENCLSFLFVDWIWFPKDEEEEGVFFSLSNNHIYIIIEMRWGDDGLKTDEEVGMDQFWGKSRGMVSHLFSPSFHLNWILFFLYMMKINKNYYNYYFWLPHNHWYLPIKLQYDVIKCGGPEDDVWGILKFGIWTRNQGWHFHFLLSNLLAIISLNKWIWKGSTKISLCQPQKWINLNKLLVESKWKSGVSSFFSSAFKPNFLFSIGNTTLVPLSILSSTSLEL